MMKRFLRFVALALAAGFGGGAIISYADNFQATQGTGFFGACKGTGADSAHPCISQVELLDSGGADLTAALGSSTARAVGIQGVTGGLAVPISGSITVSGTSAFNLTQIAGSSIAVAATGIPKFGLTDGSGTAITSTGQAVDVNIKSGGTSAVSGAYPNAVSAIGVNASGNVAPPISCDNATPFSFSTATATQLVALVSGKKVYVCGWDVHGTGTATTATLQYGTGSNCGTGTQAITQAVPASSTLQPFVDGATFYRGLGTIASNALCVSNSAAQGIAGLVYWTQF